MIILLYSYMLVKVFPIIQGQHICIAYTNQTVNNFVTDIIIVIKRLRIVISTMNQG